MATHLNPVSWEKTLSLDRQTASPSPLHFLHFPPSSPTLHQSKSDITTILSQKNCSFLHSENLRQELLQSRKAFLSFNEDEPETQEEKNVAPPPETRKTPMKKISFKIKKTSSVYRRNPAMATISASKVAELTMKFNGLGENSDQTKFKKLVKRVNSLRSVDSDHVVRKSSLKNSLVMRKPSVKTKPTFLDDKKLVIVKRVNRRVSVKGCDDKSGIDNKKCLRTKIGYLETPHVVKIEEPVRPKSLQIKNFPEVPIKPKISPTSGTVRAAIEIFERRSSQSSPIQKDVPIPVPKPKVPEKKINLTQQSQINNKTDQSKTDFDEVQIVNIPAILPQRRCDSMYETLNLKKTFLTTLKIAKSEETISAIKPNTSFLWTLNQDKSPSTSNNPLINPTENDWKSLYDIVDPKLAEEEKEKKIPQVPPRPITLPLIKPPTPPKKTTVKHQEKIYEELNNDTSHNYEYCGSSDKYEEVHPKIDDDYEYCASPEKENIYETLPAPPLLPRRQQQEPLPERPRSRSSYCTIQNSENVSNCYESIYNPDTTKIDVESNYESIYGCQIQGGCGSNRDSLVSSDQQSNSLYGRTSLVGWGYDGNSTYTGKATSDLSSSDRSDDWVDVTDNEDTDNNNSGIIIIRERQRCKKTSGWSQQFREQWSKSPRKIHSDPGVDSESDHHYETLCDTAKDDCQDDDYDSFDSDTESESSFQRVNFTDSGVDIGNNQLPEPPNNQTYVLTRLAATAGKHMRKLRRNWSLTKNDISKSLSRMTKRKSRTDLEMAGSTKQEESPPTTKPYQPPETEETDDKMKSLTRKGFLNKFRRSMSLSAESASELTSNLDKPKSTFYLTQDIDIDGDPKCESETSRDSGASLSPIQRKAVIRPQSPPPPAPEVKPNKKDKRSTSWYAEVGLFKNSENLTKKHNTFWYAEVGLYQTSRSTPSTSSAENSGNNTNVSIKTDDFINQDNNEAYYNLKNGSDYYNNSINSSSSTETKKDQSLTSLTPDIQLRLQDEPLYQFYDAAVLESVCHDGTSDFDSDGYEEVGDKPYSDSQYSTRLSSRPSAMELVSPRNSLSFSRTLWCEIPEVIQSSVLSTLNVHQKKLQEAKFEMITSEASYLNSLNVLSSHFIASFEVTDLITPEEAHILFGKVAAVKNCSEKLLWDLEKCWQDNILLHGVIDIIQKHVEENFYVYVSYCENQILLDDTLKRLKDKPAFLETLKQLETSSTCQSLTLYSFLMLPMQRVTRWPLLVDAVLKRLSPQDSEYIACQYALATINKIVSQCNEGARRKERENEMKKIVTQLEFAKGVPAIEIVVEDRFLIRSGTVTHMQPRTDEIKLTFGKRFSKIPLQLFLFNDLLLVAKPKSDNLYTVIHYCPRNLVELNSKDMLVSLPIKDTQVRHLLFLTILENQNEKTVEFLLSCGSESDKERWVEALTPPKSDNPDETLYECWDCPQVTAIHNYSASQPDELAVSRGDVINVLRKMADGWFHGERIRDGETGWFPANYTVEIANPHVRSRNLKQRYRLLAFSENYLKAK